MDDFEKEMFKKLTDTIVENQKCVSRFCDTLDIITKKLEIIFDALDKFEKFAADTFQKLNDASLCIDGLTGVLFDKKLVTTDEYKKYVTALYEAHKKRLEEQDKKAKEQHNHECNCETCSDKKEEK